MPAPITYKEINPANAFLARQAIQQYDATTNTYVPWTNGAPVTVGYYTASNATGGITGLTDLPLDEVAGEPGTYALAIPAALLVELAPYAGQIVYQIVKAGASQNLQVVTPLRVTAPRWAQ